MTLLSVNGLEVQYGGIRALRGVSFHVEEQEVVSIIGANGAGKTTTLNTIAGLKRPNAGTIEFLGQSVEKTPPHELVRMGMALSPEGRQVFPELTVEENLNMGGYLQTGEVIAERMDFVYQLFPILKERRKQPGGTLSGGEQQMLALGRALISKPKLLMLDEPSLGLAPLLVKMVLDTIPSIRENGTSVILVEQNARMALKIADRGYVLETGRIILEGESSSLLENEAVKKAYLGEGTK
ncbi:MAG: ABC transporter ATP-binding protein [Ndongobacter sp.]|nr:ABC transporter ATP-binding protein [Ndongobacter sp.]